MAKKKDQEKHKEKGIVLEGTVEDALPNAVFRVKLDTGHDGVGPCLWKDEGALYKDPTRRPGKGGALPL
jgi:hypothetical protein